MDDLIQPVWEAPVNVRAFTTTRSGGFSPAPWNSMNLGDNCGDDTRLVRKNRQLLQKLLPAEPSWLKQVHGNRVLVLDGNSGPAGEADACMTSISGQVCAVLTADCLPVLFCNRSGTKVAVAHAGWRGLANGVLEATVAAMDCKPDTLLAWLGPAIGPNAFAVGQDVFDAFTRTQPKNTSAFEPFGDHWLADLYELARLTLGRLGIKHVSGGQYCTFTERDRFFSYRRDGETGRMATVIWLSPSRLARYIDY